MTVMTVLVMTVLVMLLSRVRASSAVPWNASGANGEPGLTLMWETAYPTSNAAMALTPGSTHRDPVAYSRTASRRIMGCSSAEPSLTVRPDGESGRGSCDVVVGV